MRKKFSNTLAAILLINTIGVLKEREYQREQDIVVKNLFKKASYIFEKSYKYRKTGGKSLSKEPSL